MLEQVFSSLSAEIQLHLDQYFSDAGIAPETITKTDVVLALLRIKCPGARDAAQRLSGVKVKVLPPGMPPWPPKPVHRPARPVLVRCVPNPCAPASDAFRRYSQLRVGMSKDQIMAKGISSRDLNDWSRRGAIEFELV